MSVIAGFCLSCRPVLPRVPSDSQMMTNSPESLYICDDPPWTLCADDCCARHGRTLGSELWFSEDLAIIFHGLVCVSGRWHQQESGPHHRHRCWPAPPQQIHRVPARQRPEAEGVPLQTYPLPQEGVCAQEGRQHCKWLSFASSTGEWIAAAFRLFLFYFYILSVSLTAAVIFLKTEPSLISCICTKKTTKLIP